MKRIVLLIIAAALVMSVPWLPALAEQGKALEGSRVIATAHTFGQLVERLDRAGEAKGFVVVTRASASAGAAKRGITIPGNMVVGVFRNDFAVRMLEASIAAGIEAPIRFYLTENADGTATLSYRPPSLIFAPYGSAPLDALAAELDQVFAEIADLAVRP